MTAKDLDGLRCSVWEFLTLLAETTLGCDFLPVICTLAKTLGLTLWSAVPVSSLLTCCPSLTHVAVPDNRAGGLRGEENQLSEHSPPRACQLPGSRQRFP